MAFNDSGITIKCGKHSVNEGKYHKFDDYYKTGSEGSCFGFPQPRKN